MVYAFDDTRNAVTSFVRPGFEEDTNKVINVLMYVLDIDLDLDHLLHILKAADDLLRVARSSHALYADTLLIDACQTIGE